MVSRSPVAMTIQQRADNAATQHPGKRFLISFRLEGCDNFITARKAANVQALFIRRTTAKARIVRSVPFLDTFFSRIHLFQKPGAFAPWRALTSNAKAQRRKVKTRRVESATPL